MDTACRATPLDLLAQKIGLFAPGPLVCGQCTGGHAGGQIAFGMDAGLFGAIVMLVVWAVGTFFYDAPGWINLFLSGGVFLLIWRIVARPARKPR